MFMSNKERLMELKRAKLKYLECQLELQNKSGADVKTVHRTMKDINKLQRELNGTLT